MIFLLSFYVEDIVVVGLFCCFLGVDMLEIYWLLLFEGCLLIVLVLVECWGCKILYYVGMIEDVSYFDFDFFLFYEEDVRVMDL